MTIADTRRYALRNPLQMRALNALINGKQPRAHDATLAALVRRDLIRMDMGRWVLTEAGQAFCNPQASPGNES